MVRFSAILFLLVSTALGQYVDTEVGGVWRWSPAEYEFGIAKYEVQIRYDDDGAWYGWADDVSAIPVNGLIVFRYSEIPQPTQKYSIRVRAIGHDGEVGPFSEESSLKYERLTDDTSSAPLSPWDVNTDRRVDIVDLMTVSKSFGDSGHGLRGDVNADGVIDILDLVLVGTHFGETTELVAQSTPPLPSDEYTHLLEHWLIEARIASDGSEVFRQGIIGLERLLAEMRPDHTALLSNYPNPFNPETWIPYQLHEATEVTLTIYDPLGRLVKRLAVGHQAPGIYRSRDRAIHWDGRDRTGESVASGIYFCTLRTDAYVATKRMAILR